MNISINDFDFGMALLDLNGNIIDHNDAFLKIIESNCDDLNSKGLSAINSEIKSRTKSYISGKDHSEPLIEIYCLKTANDFDKFVKVIINKTGQDDVFALSLVDITSIKNMEMNYYNRNRIVNLKKLTELISLEYNNQLAVILGFASFGKNLLSPATEIYRILESIENSASKASSLTNQLLTFCGSEYFRQTNVNLNKLIVQTISIFNNIFTPNIKIDLDLFEGDLLIYWDENQINQIIINTIINAKEAIDNTYSSGVITIRTKIENNHIVYLIEDTGTGINNDNLDKIFNPHFTTKDINSHSGMGLAVVDGIVRNLNGKIGVFSAENKTMFKIEFPDKVKSLDKENHIKNKDSGNKETILIIDDKRSIRTLTSILLSEKNYNPITASNSTEALEILKKEKIDLILLDVMMPDMNGVELFYHIKVLYNNIPVILLTGTSDEKILNELVKKEGAGIIYKPFKNYEFYQIIEDKLKNKQK